MGHPLLSPLCIFLLGLATSASSEATSLAAVISRILLPFDSTCSITVSSGHKIPGKQFELLHIRSLAVTLVRSYTTRPPLAEKAHHYRLKLHLRTQTASQRTRRYSHCSSTVLFIEDLPINFEQDGDFTEGGDNPNRYPFFLVGNQATLDSFMARKAVDRIRYKVGIISVIDDYSGVRLHPHHLTHGGFERRISISGRHLRASAFRVDPYVAWKSDTEPFMGYYYTITRTASERYNFTFFISLPSGSIIALPNGSWEGVVGEIVNNDGDFIVGLGITEDRLSVLDHTSTFGNLGLMFYTSHPRIGVKLGALLYVFEPTVWLLTGIALVTIVICIFVGLLKDQNSLNKHHRSGYADLLWQALLIPYRTIVDQHNFLPRNFEGKSFLAICLFFSLIIGAFYESNLISYLTLPDEDPVPRNYDDLAAMTDFHLNFMSLGGAGVAFFQKTQQAKFVSIRERYEIQQDHLQCMMDAAFKKKSVCIAWNLVGFVLIAKNLTLVRGFEGLLTSTESAVRLYSGIAFPKCSKYLVEFNEILIRLRDSGHMNKYLNDLLEYRTTEGIHWLKQNEDGMIFKELSRLSVKDDSVKPFGFANVAVAFVILLIGIIAAIVSHVGEIALHFAKRPRGCMSCHRGQGKKLFKRKLHLLP